jgi:dTMP kinase
MADAIRLVIKNGDLAREPETNLLLFTAARREIWHHARQVLALGTWVVSARNYYSTLAYQGYGEGVDPAKIMALTELFLGKEYAHPDWAGILSLDDIDERERRIRARGTLDVPDTFESRDSDFQDRVNCGYVEIAKTYGLEIISAHQPQLAITDAIYASITGASSLPHPHL